MKNFNLYFTIFALFTLISISCSRELDNNDISIVTNTSTDQNEPWLNIREKEDFCSKVIGRMKDGTKIKVIEESGDYFKIETIPISGYVHKNYITKLRDIHFEAENDLLNISNSIFNAMKNDFSLMKNFIHQDTVRFFYWDVLTCNLDNKNINSLEIYNEDYSGEKYKIKCKRLLPLIYNVKPKFMHYCGLEHFPAAGFGGGSVSMPDSTIHTVSIGEDEPGYGGDELWFMFKETETGYTLVEVGSWSWTP